MEIIHRKLRACQINRMSEKNFTRHIILAVRDIKKFLDENPANGISTTMLAASAGISRSILHQAFKEEFGTEIGEYKLRLRMEVATQLLLAGKSVKEVSIHLHYASPSTFSNAFRNYFGQSPSQWLASNKL
jgi:AraC-like DNA-binding protein